MGFPGGASGEEPTCRCRRHKKCGFNPWVRKIPWRRHGNPFQYSCLENPMDRGAWRATVHRVTKSQTWLKWFSTHTQFSHISGILQCLFVTFYSTWHIILKDHLCAYVRISFLLKLNNVLSHIYATFYLFICLWTCRLLSSLGYCEQCCYEHGCTTVSSRPCFQFFCMGRSRVAGSYGNTIFNFFEKPPYCFLQWLHHFTFLSTCTRVLISLYSCKHLLYSVLFLSHDSHPNWGEVVSPCALNLHFPPDKQNWTKENFLYYFFQLKEIYHAQQKIWKIGKQKLKYKNTQEQSSYLEINTVIIWEISF